MRAFFALILAAALAGCTAGHFKMPREDYRQEVRTLGVLPLLVDGGSTILHPRREEVVDLLYRHSAGKEEWLIEALREQKAYFDVREVPGAPSALLRRLVTGSSIAGDGAGRFRSYRFTADEAAALCRANGVDAVLAVILNGIVRPEKRWDRDRTSLNYLETDVNVVVAGAAVILPDGSLAWEYVPEPGEAFLALQYPDFDEAYYNASDEVRLHFVEIGGLDRLLARREDGLLFRSSLPERYRDLFADLAGALAPRLLDRIELVPAGDAAAPPSRPQ